MKSKFILAVLLFLLVCSSFVFAISKETEILTQIKDIDDSLDVVVENISDMMETTISKDSNKIIFKDLKDETKLTKIEFKKDSRFDTTVVRVENLNFTDATLFLEKNNNSFINMIYHSEDGVNFYREKDIEINQNKTHVWFKVTHFSSWSANMDDIWIFQEANDGAGDKVIVTIDLTDFSTVTGTDCMAMRYEDDYEESTTSVSTCASGTVYDEIVYSDHAYCFGDEMYRFDLSDIELEITPHPDCDVSWTDNLANSRFIIYEETGNTEQDSSNQINIVFDSSYDEPTVSSYSASDITDTEASIHGRVYYNDLDADWVYDYSCGGACETYYFQYRKYGVGVWTDTTEYDTISDSSYETEDLTGLDVGTTYEYRMVFDYFSLVADDGGDYETLYSSTKQFTTTGGAEPVPTVETLSASVGNELAYLRATVDFDGFTDTIGLAFNYSCDGGTSYTRHPAGTSYYSPSDGVILVSDVVSGLTNGVQCQYFSWIVNVTAGYPIMDNTSDSLVYFTPYVPSVSAIKDKFSGNLTIFLDFEDRDNESDSLINLGSVVFSAVNIGADYSTDGMEFVKANADLINLTDYDFIGSGLNPHVSAIMINLTDTPAISGYYRFWNLKQTSQLLSYVHNNAGTYEWHCGFRDLAPNLEFKIEVDFEAYEDEISLFTCEYTGGAKDTIGSYNFYINGVLNTTNKAVAGAGGSKTTNEIGGESSTDMITKWFAVWNSTTLTTEEHLELYEEGLYDILDTGATVETLDANNITYNEVNLRGVPIFEINMTGWLGNFNWRINNTSVWNNISVGGLGLTNLTTYNFIVENLTYNTTYEYQAFVFNSSTEVYGNLSYFTTLFQPAPLIATLSAQNVDNESATLRGSISNLYDWNYTKIHFSFKKTSEENYTQILNIGNITGIDTYTYNYGSFEAETDYLYYFEIDYGDNDSYFYNTDGGVIAFSTSETGAPVINTEDASNIKRYTADLNCNISDLGIYENITMYIRYGNSTDNFTTFEIPYYTDDVSFSESVTNLSINTTYNYECIGLYDNENRNVTGGIIEFTTLSLLDFIAPEVQGYMFDTDVGYDDVLLYLDLDLNDINFTTIYYKVYDTDSILINSSSQFKNTSEIFTYTMGGLESNTDYIYESFISYGYNASVYVLYSDTNYTFTTLDISDAPKYIEFFGSHYIENPPKFRFILLYFIPLLVAIFLVSLINTSNPELKQIIMLVLASVLHIGVMLWLYIAELLSIWFIIIVLFACPILFLMGKGGIDGY